MKVCTGGDRGTCLTQRGSAAVEELKEINAIDKLSDNDERADVGGMEGAKASCNVLVAEDLRVLHLAAERPAGHCGRRLQRDHL
jgi:hypothetical protein